MTGLKCSTLVVSLALLSVASADTLIVLNKAAGSATLIDRATGKELATLPTATGPHEVAVSPDGKLAVGAEYGGGRGQDGKSLVVMDLVARKVLKTIDLGAYRRPHGIEFLPGGKQLAVTAERNRALLIVNLADGKIVAAIDTGQAASHMVALSPQSGRAYVANIGPGSITVIDLKARKRLKIIKTDRGAEGIAVKPGGGEVWVTNRAAGNVSVVSEETLEVVATLPCPGFPIRVKFTPDGKRALVSCAFAGEVAIFDVKARRVVKRLKVAAEGQEQKGNMFRRRGPLPIGIVVAADGKQAFVACGGIDSLVVIDMVKLEIANRFKTGREPDGLAYSPK